MLHNISICGIFQLWVLALVCNAKQTYFMDDYTACGKTIRDANMREGDVYEIVSNQWSNTYYSARYGPKTCSIGFNFVDKKIKVVFITFRIDDCDVEVKIRDGDDESATLIKTLNCLTEKKPGIIYTSGPGVRFDMSRQETKDFTYKIELTAVEEPVSVEANVIVGIVCGIILLALVIIATVALCIWQKRRRKMRERRIRAYTSPALIEREEGLTIINRLGISRDDLRRDFPRPNHRRAYRHSYISAPTSIHIPVEEGPPPYCSMPDLRRSSRNSRNRRNSQSGRISVAEPEDTSDRSLQLTSTDYPDNPDPSERLPLSEHASTIDTSERSPEDDYRPSPARSPRVDLDQSGSLNVSLEENPGTPVQAHRSIERRISALDDYRPRTLPRSNTST